MRQLVLIATIKAAKGFERKVQDALKALVEPTNAEDGCLQYSLHRNLDNSDTFMMYEVWRDETAWKQHMQTGHIQSFQSETEGQIVQFDLQRYSAMAFAD